MPRIDLSTIPTRAPEGLTKDEAKRISRRRADEIADLHQQLVAEKKHAVLIILQGMDASGKDGALRNVFGKCAPYGLRTVGWTKPTEREFAHDFLWRIHREVPARGELVIFNRSHYEDVLIQRVHGWIDEERVNRRIESINAFERLLVYDTNTLILKFYLHISEAKQREELLERVHEYDKHYKHNDGDWEERKHWDAYREAYEDVIARSEIPWHVVGTDQRWYRDYRMTEIILEALRGLDMQWPPLKTDRDPGSFG
jgi:PPK2 family polyphosphate:nucleotide phosphotransferase